MQQTHDLYDDEIAFLNFDEETQPPQHQTHSSSSPQYTHHGINYTRETTGGLSYLAYQEPMIPLEEEYEIAPFELHDVFSQQERSVANEIKWGAIFGAFFMTSVFANYMLWSGLSQYFVPPPSNGTVPNNTTTPTNSSMAPMLLSALATNGTNTTSDPFSFNSQLAKFNFISNDSMGLAGATIFSFLTYMAATAAFFAIANPLWERAGKPLLSKMGLEFWNPPKQENVNRLYDIVTGPSRPLRSTKHLKVLMVVAFFAFVFPNAFYEFTYLDKSGSAAKNNYLPDYGSPMYASLNENAGRISYFMNFALNQWFAFGIISLCALSLKSISMTRKNYHNTGNAAYPNLALSGGVIVTLALVSSLAFIFLTKDDDSLGSHGAFLEKAIPLSSPFVYGILNSDGALGVKASIGNFWAWLNRFPEALEELSNAAKGENKWLTTYVIGSVLSSVKDNVIEWGKEAGYYLWCNSKYINKNDLNLPRSAASIKAPLLPPNTPPSRERESKNEKPRIKPAKSLDELKAEVDRRIRVLDRVESNTKAQLPRIICEARESFHDARIAPTTTKDIWYNGRVRKPIATIAGLTGPAGLSVVLFAYFALVNGKLNERVYNDWFNVGLKEADAWSLMASFLLFYTFVKLVHNAGYSQLSKLYSGFEHKAWQLYNSGSVLYHWIQLKTGSRELTDPGLITSASFNYEERFHFTTKREAAIWALSGFVFALQVTAFVVTPCTAGTAVALLAEYGHLNLITQNVAFWFTALFNSFGLAGFLEYAKEGMINRFSYADEPSSESPGLFGRFYKYWFNGDRQDLYDMNQEFFDAVKDERGIEFNIDELDPDDPSTGIATLEI